ncbi:hypothetical protein [Sinorhizobium fredii]|uniref:hypothetical protein n=1 Tax=Rhizobium fredii TaxID=380 RepID=UPI0012FE55E6|nr:hypothetical protein [Sinorhizobium fredii]
MEHRPQSLLGLRRQLPEEIDQFDTISNRICADGETAGGGEALKIFEDASTGSHLVFR